MRKKISESRRNFLRTSALGAVGLTVAGPLVKKAAAANINVTLANLSTTPINTDVDNLRVTYITDPAMMYNGSQATPTYPGWTSFNSPTNATTGVNYTKVQSNMDLMACALANNTDVSAAWATLLKIPTSKTWATAKAAIKVNAFAGDHPSVPIVAKICRVLVGFGMPPANITIFCLSGGASGLYNNSTFMGTNSQLIPTGVLYGVGGGVNNVVFPASEGGESFNCSTCVDGVDVFVNLACNKGHDQFNEYSGVTMSQKNNKGTIWFACNDGDGTKGTTRLVSTNSCNYIVGNIPTTYPAKQQLCIVDSLWLGDPGQWSGSITNGNNANSLVMGTFPGAVDYVATMKIRAIKIAASTWNQPIVDRFVTGYGYATTAITTLMTPLLTGAGPGLVNASNFGEGTLPNESPKLSRQGNVQFSVSGNGVKDININLYLGNGETVQSAEIFNVQGRKVRTLALNSGSNHIVWDGRNDSGSLAKSGNYVVRIRGQKSATAGDVALSR